MMRNAGSTTCKTVRGSYVSLWLEWLASYRRVGSRDK